MKCWKLEFLTPKKKSGSQMSCAAEHGGADEAGNKDELYPAAIIVLIDLKCVRLPSSYGVGFEVYRSRKLKEQLRSKYDLDGKSSIHSTDNTLESWEYIEVCFGKEEIAAIQETFNSYAQSSVIEAFKNFFNFAYLKHSVKHSPRGYFIRKFLS